MTVTELLAIFANPEAIQQLTSADKMTAGLVTTILGMGITFAALISLLLLLSLFDKLLHPKKTTKEVSVTEEPSVELQVPPENTNKDDDRELVAAITTALAMTLKTSVDNIIIRNFERVEDNSPAWNRAGIIEQMNSRL